MSPRSAPLTRFQSLPDGQPQDYQPGAAPLEAWVERERVRPLPTFPHDRRAAAEAGLTFLRLLGPLRARYGAAFAAAYPLAPPVDRAQWDEQSLRLFDALTGRAPDGDQLAQAFAAASGSLPAAPPIASADAAAVGSAAAAFLARYGALFSEPDPEQYPCWDSTRMEHAFQLAGSFGGEQPASEVLLTARAFHGGHLDWPAFDVTDGSLSAEARVAAITSTTLPTRVTYAGMPAARFWQFEDAAVDFGAIEAPPGDVGRLLFVEFALAFGNDWSLVPLELSAGTLTLIDKLIVRDSFGVEAIVPHAASTDATPTLRLFTLSAERSPGSKATAPPRPLLFLPDSCGPDLVGATLEQVLFLRDEGAEQHWAIEQIVQAQSGAPLDRRAAALEHARQSPPPVPPPARAALVYRLLDDLPEEWFPLAAHPSAPELLRIADVLQPDGSYAAPTPEGEILALEYANGLQRGEVVREGLAVRRRYRRVRGPDGRVYLWLGRERGVAAGGARSGQRFDRIDG